eukprot:gene13754-18447_t
MLSSLIIIRLVAWLLVNFIFVDSYNLLNRLPNINRNRGAENYSTSKGIDLNLLKSYVNLPQSVKNRKLVEEEIDIITTNVKNIKLNSRKYMQELKPGSWRTIWTSVSSDNFIAMLFKLPPSNILGGKSWQIVSNDLKVAENIVYWDNKYLNQLRMVGTAAINYSKNNNDNYYSLSIKGLSFRWGIHNKNDNIPELIGIMGEEANKFGNYLKLFLLSDKQTL